MTFDNLQARRERRGEVRDADRLVALGLSGGSVARIGCVRHNEPNQATASERTRVSAVAARRIAALAFRIAERGLHSATNTISRRDIARRSDKSVGSS